ncbi:hypothetical protein RGQ29_021343 [Quercus rubra]|uniref:Response regulatory domain-containing protein n=1 Tax=Quercus rubra TaxID=3512 RepID=A0AAN7FH78_QUERU|nr:hypothetical protein RGQ29_021343 [Quercus rubra]
MDLPVIVIATSEDTQPNIVQWSLENGTCDYLLKPIPMNVLKMVWKYMFFKKDNNVSRVNNQRMSWTPDSHEKFVESVRKLGGADSMSLFPNLICINLLFSHSSHLSAHVHFVHCF